jgi:hydrogenase maturation protein HypF
VTATAGAALVRARARVRGTVQGVGFRPHVYRLARELGLAGWVRNDARGVTAEVEGTPAAVDAFFARLAAEAPPLARVQGVEREPLAPSGAHGFAIVTSAAGGSPDAAVSPDVATCEDCLAELFDPADRRYRYPFVNCTSCGPRFTIAKGVPYDRPLTTMASFAMCPDCRREYDDPADRRFHAQPNACPACGPHVRLVGREAAGDPIEAAARALVGGLIVAVKGVGGYHLACDAGNEWAVRALRTRKHREDRPFALIARDLAAARELVELTAEDEELLCSRARPIVLAARCPGASVGESVAPATRELGVMLPYAPLHHLLLADVAALAGGALVLTSGNVSDEPIAYDDADALERLDGIADLFLVHDRPIHIRTDDSVVRSVRVDGVRRPLVIRRSRGFVPDAAALPVPARRPLLAVGAEQKNTFCVAKGARAWVGHHVGDLEHFATHTAFRDGIEHFERLFAVEPALIAHDLHPDYLSTAYAFEREGVELVGVQHHHAHLAACLAEHGLAGDAVGAIYDGTGYGTDGTVWGGELLAGGLRSFERVGHLRPVRLPGGAAAIREPWRMACAWLTESFGEPRPLPATLRAHVDPERWSRVADLARSGLASPVTTSMGRLFDAVAALCGIVPRANYEGQAAVELEAAADRRARGAYVLPVAAGPPLTLDARETIRQVVADLEAGVEPGPISARFHAAVADATAAACAGATEARGLDTVVLSGGVFQNSLLLEAVAERLAAVRLRVLVPRVLPPNDGGISYGQAAVAAARDAGAPDAT